MIFVSVGTHEQPFNRLVEHMDNWAANNDEKVIIQTGYSTFTPEHSEWKKWFPYEEMMSNVAKARIIITHGGPSSFIMPLQIGKIPIVVPRKSEFSEHVNNHQVDFCKEVSRRQKNIILVEDIEKLDEIISSYERIAAKLINAVNSNNERFCENFELIVEELVKKDGL